MFKWTNTLIVNSNLDSSGKPKWSAQAEDTGSGVVGSFEFKRVNKFLKPNVVAIYKKEASDPVLGKVTFTMSNQGVGNYRVALYIRLSGSQNSYYSNDFVFKGKPLMYEFAIKNASATAADVAKEAARVIEKIQTIYGDHWIKASANGNNLVIEGMDEYQLFTKAEIQKFNPDLNTALVGGEFETIATALPADDPDYDRQNTIVKSKEGFGTYWMILKDLRLPTMEARRFAGINEEELPVPGAKYNEYIINYCVNRGIMGGDAVGEVTRSLTTHVFYVKQDLAADFEAALAKIGTIGQEVTPGETAQQALEASSANAAEIAKLKTGKANVADVYTKTEADAKFEPKV